MLRSEQRSAPRGLADLLLPYALVEDGILLQQDGSLIAGWSFQGPDMMAASPSEMSALSARLNQCLRLGSGWMVHCDAIRSQAPGYPQQGNFKDPVTHLIDDERRQQFLQEGAHYESEYFLVLTYLPPIEAEERAKGWLFDGGAARPTSHTASQVLDRFRGRIDSFENVFGSLFKTRRLKADCIVDEFGDKRPFDNLLAYLNRCIGGIDQPFALPEFPCYLNEILASGDFIAGIEPQIGPNHIRVIAVDGFPRLSSPGLLRELDALSIRYRWSTRAVLIDSEESRTLLDKHRKKWKSKIRGWKDQMLRSETGAVNANAREMMDDAEQAMSIAASGDVQFCLYSSNIICLDEDLGRLQESIRAVMKVIQNLGFACRIETVNAVEAWRGSIPGDGYPTYAGFCSILSILPICCRSLPYGPDSARTPRHSCRRIARRFCMPQLAEQPRSG